MSKPEKCWCGGVVQHPAYSPHPAAERPTCAASKYHDPLATGKREIKTVYIAGPMSGYEDCNYPAFHRAAEQLQQAGFEVMNPANADKRVEFGHYTDFLREDLRMLLDSDAVALLPNWFQSVGARNEVQVAGTIGMEVHPIAHFLQGAETTAGSHVARKVEPVELMIRTTQHNPYDPYDPYDRVAVERAERRRSAASAYDAYGRLV